MTNQPGRMAEDDLALLYARTLAVLREAAWALLHHDTPENRARLHQLVAGPDGLILDGVPETARPEEADHGT